MGRLLSVNVGLPRDISWQGKTVHTGVWKSPVKGPRKVRRLNLEGDGQGDTNGHGGERRAVSAYQNDSYEYWKNYLGRQDFTYGQFGENFTVEGLLDTQVCIGDRYKIGTALFEVTQPRVTCYRLGIRMNEPQMAALLVKHGRPGFYFRVLEEGEVEPGDEITLVAAGPERMSISEIDALLYKPGRSPEQLQRALRIPALSIGWRKSFEALLEQEREGIGLAGNAGLTTGLAPLPAWRGFRPLRVSSKISESSSVISLQLEPLDGSPLPPPLPGQFLVLRFTRASGPTIMRSYSLSGPPHAPYYRVSVKREAHGAAGGYVADELQVGDILQASAARGNFTLRPGSTPVIMLSAGIGVTPVLSMLHALAAQSSPREVWWLYGTRNGRQHPFAEETRRLLNSLARHHSRVCYSSPDPADRADVDYNAVGRIDLRLLQELNVPLNGDFYICGPSTFMSDLTAGLTRLGAAPRNIHTELFGTGPFSTPGIAPQAHQPPHLPQGPVGSGPLVSFARSGLNVRWDPSRKSLLELAEACDVPVRWACRTGVCHSCESGLVAGTVAYHPDPIDAPIEGNVLICCAQPRDDIVIDL